MASLKVRLLSSNEYRIISLLNSSLQDCRQKIKNLFKLDTDEFDIIYVDSQGDSIVMSSQEEFCRFLGVSPTLGGIFGDGFSSEAKRVVIRISKPTPSNRPLSPLLPTDPKQDIPNKTREGHQQQATTSLPAAPSPTPASDPEPVNTTPNSSSLPSFPSFSSQLQNALNQIGKELVPLQQLAAQKSQHQVDEMTGAAMAVWDNALRTAAQKSQLAAQKSQHQVDEMTGIAMAVLDNALRTAADTANTIHQTMSPLLQRHNTYTNTQHYRQQQQPTTTSSSNDAPVEKSSYSIYCDMCYRVVGGNHWTCAQCPDYHVCASCQSRGGFLKSHNPSHVLKNVGDPPVAPMEADQSTAQEKDSSRSINTKNTDVIHDNVVCDHCGKTLIGIRYKCGHCADYDLCETCEPLLTHDQRHIFLKIRHPLSSTRNTGTTTAGPLLPILEFAVKPTESTTHEKPEANPDTEAVANDDSNSQDGNKSTPRPQHHDSHRFGLSHGLLSAAFVEDVNFPDGCEVLPGSSFFKVWKLKNDGLVRWPSGSKLVYTGGDVKPTFHQGRDDKAFYIPNVAPGEEAKVMIALSAPQTPGNYIGYFRLLSAEGIRFGARLWCDITVLTPNGKSRLDIQQQQQPIADTTLIDTPLERSFQSTTSMVYPTPSTEHRSSVSSLYETSTVPSVYTATTQDNESIRGSSEDEDPFQDPYYNTGTTPLRSINSQSSSLHSDNTARSAKEIYPTATQHAPFDSLNQQDEYVSPFTISSIPNEKSPLSNSTQTVDDGFEWVAQEQVTRTPHEMTENNHRYPFALQLAQLHEMGITYCDELAVKMLKVHDGDLGTALPEILETLYPE